jgi:hypothetical protein
VCASALVALYTGQGRDFFLIQIFSNIASADRVGAVHRAALAAARRRRGDRPRPEDAMASRSGAAAGVLAASWVWVAQYVFRLVVFIPLWQADQVIGLTAARVALSWPLIAVCLAVSWWVLRRSLPADHPGLATPSSSPPDAPRSQ